MFNIYEKEGEEMLERQRYGSYLGKYSTPDYVVPPTL